MDLTASVVDRLFVHRIGNKLREEKLKLSNSESPVTDELSGLILRGYLKGIASERNEYHFHHETDLALNEARFYVGQYFRGEIDFAEVSRRLATHLYENSLHPNIRQGDFLVIQFDGIVHNNRQQRALGLFKSDVLDNYLTVTDGGDTLKVVPSVGINPNLIDKGALILEFDDAVFALDRFGNKTKFWLDDFLKVKKSADPSTCSKVMSFIAGKIAEAIENPMERLRYNESISALCDSDDSLHADALAKASEAFVEPDLYQSTIAKAQRRYGLDNFDDISAPSIAVSKNLTKKVTKLSLGHDVSLLLPSALKLTDFKTAIGPDGELVLTIRLGNQHER